MNPQRNRVITLVKEPKDGTKGLIGVGSGIIKQGDLDEWIKNLECEIGFNYTIFGHKTGDLRLVNRTDADKYAWGDSDGWEFSKSTRWDENDW